MDESRDYKRLNEMLQIVKNETEEIRKLTDSEAYKAYERAQKEKNNHIIMTILVSVIGAILAYGVFCFVYHITR